MMRRLLLAGAVMAAAGLGYYYYGQQRPATTTAPPPPPRSEPVVAAEIRVQPMAVEVAAVGTVQAAATVALRSRIDGEVVAVHFRDGDLVQAGALLFSLDARGPEADVRRAEATLAKDQATLANARRDLTRYEQLQESAVSRQKLDEARTSAQVLEAAVRADEAAVATARLQLSYTRIQAPMEGRTGSVALSKGNIVKANDPSPLVVIHRVDPMDVAFAVPQRELPAVREAQAGGPVAVRVTVPGDRGGPVEGRLSFIDNAVETMTGTILLKATFANADGRLWPGQLVDVVLTLRTESDAVVCPTPAIQKGQSGTYVFVIRPDSTVDIRPVVVDRARQGLSVIRSGLAAGDRVVVDGQFRLVPGSRVEVKPAAGTPAKAAAPLP
ncbi:MAG: efflux RND transporter periplasmic adaptor subunit [Alphaproteobacteria bacterium]